ncbi:MAG: RNA-binding protein [Thermoplasmata archaeon]|nr:RNA-binding protein [Thermoplasmata archaeon]
MNENKSRENREVFLPGDEVGGGDLRAGAGTYSSDGKIFASQIGIKSIRSNFVNIIPMGGAYVPRIGDQVIAYVTEMGPTYWLTDIKSPYPAPLHVNDTPWKVDFGDTGKYLKVGDAIIVVISEVDEIRHVQISMREHGHRRLNTGLLMEMTPSKVPRVIGKSGSMISLIKDGANCRMFVGQNGRIWVDGEEDSMELALQALDMIEKHAHSSGLTDRVKTLLGGHRTESEKKPAEERKETPVKEMPAKEMPVKEAPVKEMPVKEAPVKETPVKEAPVKEAPVKEEGGGGSPKTDESPVKKEE